MEAAPAKFPKALLIRLEASGVRYARALGSRVDSDLSLEPAGKLRFRKIGFDAAFLRTHICQHPVARAPDRRIARLSMRADFADGGPTLARELDEGEVW
jgi:hypothetical protein